MNEIKSLMREIQSGDLSGKKLKKAKHRLHYLKAKAKRADQPRNTAMKAPRFTAKQKGFDSKQGILPNFLSMVNTARVEELVAEKIFQALGRGLARDEQVVRPIFKAVK